MRLEHRRVAAARLSAVARMPYLASAILASPLRVAPGSGTIAIDERWRIAADPLVVAELDAEELDRLLIHLAGHAIRDHAGRARAPGVARDAAAARWNRCADAEINDDLASADAVPRCASDQPQAIGCEPHGLAEAYYADARDGPRRWDCGSGADGRPRRGEGEGEGAGGEGIGGARAELLRLGVAAEIQRHAGREPGSVPAGWLRWAESVRPSRTDWRRVLAAGVRGALGAVAGLVDYSHRRPARRQHLSPCVILPAMLRPVPEVAIVCDTSGSMHERLFARALAEIEAVLARAGLRGPRVRVLAVDAAVAAISRVSRAAGQVLLAGGGGTDMGRGIAAAAALRPRPSVVIVLTDGFTPWPERPPPGVRVLVGLLLDAGAPAPAPAPGWARSVLIDELSERP